MHVLIESLNVMFGRGTDDHPFWLLAVRLDIILFVLCSAVVVGWAIRPTGMRRIVGARGDLWLLLALTVLAGTLRSLVAPNLTALGGIGYSRILLGYRGHFGTAQLYSLVYPWAGRSLETAIVLNRVASTLTVPLLYLLCRRLVPAKRTFAVAAGVLVALHPLHLLFTATDGLPISTALLAVWSYLLLAVCIDDADTPDWVRTMAGAGAATGTVLFTQVRYENVVFVVPPLLYLLVQRRRARFRPLAPGALLFAGFASVFALAALSSGREFQSAVPVSAGLSAAVRELAGNPMFAIGPTLLGTAAAIALWRGPMRWLAPLPAVMVIAVVALAIALERHDYAAGFVPLARIYANQLLLPTLVAAYGLAWLWHSPWRDRRILAAGCLLWAAMLPAVFWANLRERYLEMAEHDFLRTSLAVLPPEVDRLVVPDDGILLRDSHSTIELITKYSAIAGTTRSSGIELVGLTSFLERPGAVDCSHDNCVFFYGLPCAGTRYYWFAAPQCAQLMATRGGAALREEDVTGGSFLDCSLSHGTPPAPECAGGGVSRRFGLYRIAP